MCMCVCVCVCAIMCEYVCMYVCVCVCVCVLLIELALTIEQSFPPTVFCSIKYGLRVDICSKGLVQTLKASLLNRHFFFTSNQKKYFVSAGK